MSVLIHADGPPALAAKWRLMVSKTSLGRRCSSTAPLLFMQRVVVTGQAAGTVQAEGLAHDMLLKHPVHITLSLLLYLSNAAGASGSGATWIDEA